MDMPPLFGLVLAGGRSTRMGQDKGSLALDGESLRQRAARLLADYADQVFVSCRPDQVAGLEPGLQPLCDETPDLGPLSGIAAAFRHRPDVAWLTLPCDMPGVTTAVLEVLVAARSGEAPAVAFQRPDGNGPDPLVAVWEPEMASVVAEAMRAGEQSPRRLLQASGCRLVAAPDPAALGNLNTAADWQQWLTWRENQP
jgi:molybdopterin-guanine dinucleotide biosynthesis protein A